MPRAWQCAPTSALVRRWGGPAGQTLGLTLEVWCKQAHLGLHFPAPAKRQAWGTKAHVPAQQSLVPWGKGRLEGKTDEHHHFPPPRHSSIQDCPVAILWSGSPSTPKKASAELMRNSLFLMSQVKQLWVALFGCQKQRCRDKRRTRGRGGHKLSLTEPLPFPCASLSNQSPRHAHLHAAGRL